MFMNITVKNNSFIMNRPADGDTFCRIYGNWNQNRDRPRPLDRLLFLLSQYELCWCWFCLSWILIERRDGRTNQIQKHCAICREAVFFGRGSGEYNNKNCTFPIQDRISHPKDQIQYNAPLISHEENLQRSSQLVLARKSKQCERPNPQCRLRRATFPGRRVAAPRWQQRRHTRFRIYSRWNGNDHRQSANCCGWWFRWVVWRLGHFARVNSTLAYALHLYTEMVFNLILRHLIVNTWP